MADDLKKIKKLYGEAMMHFCRDSFSTILEEKGKLPEILQNNFAPSHMLYEDILTQAMTQKFKNFIYDLFHKKEEDIEYQDLSAPKVLMKQVGYTLYECKTEEDIQNFKKYYAKGEELCTFHGGRLKICHVFFAVKDNVDEINRVDFSNPERQDEYGTSVISIQFSRDSSHTLSIKNRYNHTVSNPDATFRNDLDQIIPGLTKSFEKYYGLRQAYKNYEFEIMGYIRANDGRWYKYNYEENNIYYCSDNVIIDNFKVKKYEKEKYVIMDYLILDLVEKRLYLYDEELGESLPNVIGKIKRISVVKKGEEKEISIINDRDEEMIITINKNSQIICLKSNDIKQVGDDFLKTNATINNIELPSLEQVGRYFLANNEKLVSFELPSLKLIGNGFLISNLSLSNIQLPSLEEVGNFFLASNASLTVLSLPKLKKAGNMFLALNTSLKILELPQLQVAGDCFLKDHELLDNLKLPKLMQVGDGFFWRNESIKTVDLPNLQQVGSDFLGHNPHVSYQILKQIEENQGMKK